MVTVSFDETRENILLIFWAQLASDKLSKTAKTNKHQSGHDIRFRWSVFFFFTLIEVVRFGSDISITALAVVKSRCL